ncbi:MAG: AAA family ATPase [Alphaproteobacteria bacterium]|nr:AAA family ATPase [Alphaproteobacteria bacterium]
MAINVAEWLLGLGLEQYTALFADNHIDGEVLAELTAQDLGDLGITSIGHRRKLLSAIAALHGAPITAATPAAAAAETSFVERRQLTILFCDLVGSTALATRLDPEDLRDIIAAYHSRVSGVVARFGGYTARLMGDGALAYFGYPSAHEDDAERAVRAALTIVEAIDKLGLAHALQVRIGIATGLVVVGDLIGEGGGQEQTVVGDTPNLAARLQTVAAPNTVIVADATRRQLGTLFQLQDLGELALKGFADDQRAWRVTGESGVVSRFAALRTPETPLIGREEELDLLLRRWAQAKAGEGRVVLLSADAGIGKSRLAEALLERIAPENHTRLRYFCSPHHQDSALFPLISQLERAAGFVREDQPSEQLEKLARVLPVAGPSRVEQVAIFADLLSLVAPNTSALVAELSPQRKKEITFEALIQQLQALARDKPVVAVFEDLHWIDPTTRELLDRVIAHIERLPVLLICTSRPEFQPPWTGQPFVTTLVLSRLGRREGAALVRHLVAAASSLPTETIEEIVERADGVPLFLEEVIKVVLETAVSASASPVSSRRSQLAVPPTLQASLMARLDRLGPVAREISQAGAAIGRDFSYELLVAASPREESETRSALDKLVAAGLVFQRGLPPKAEYQFKHALVQDTAYSSLLRGPRQNLHARIAEALQQQSADFVERSPELLAHHLAEAGAFDRAAVYWLEAGERASSHSANLEAIAHLTHGIVGLSDLPPTPDRMRQELALQLALGPVMLSTRGYGAADSRKPYRRAAELAGKLGDDRARFAASWGLWITTPGRGRDEEERLKHLADLVEAAERIGDPELSLQAHHSAWATRIWGGEFVQSQGHIREGLSLYQPEKHARHALLYGGHDPGVCGNGQSAIALWALGYPDRAMASARDGIVLAERLKHVPSLLHALWFAGAVSVLRRDGNTTRQFGQRLLALGEEHGLTQYRAIGGILHGWAVTQEGRLAEGREELRQSVELYGAQAWTMLALFRALLAEADIAAGEFDSAESLLTEMAESGNRWWWAELLRLQGDLQRARPVANGTRAEAVYRDAFAVARRQTARSLELRAATSLARLLREDGQSAKAAALLSPICDWFTEGLDTPDIVQAKALLESLE